MLLNYINPRPRGAIVPPGVFEKGCSLSVKGVKHCRESGFSIYSYWFFGRYVFWGVISCWKGERGGRARAGCPVRAALAEAGTFRSLSGARLCLATKPKVCVWAGMTRKRAGRGVVWRSGSDHG